MVPSMFFHSAGSLRPPRDKPTQPVGFWEDWEQDLGFIEKQQQCPVVLQGGRVVTGIQEGFLKEAAVGLLSDSELGGWKGSISRPRE